MQIDLTEQELREVEDWYIAAANEECTTAKKDFLFLLLQKLGFEIHEMDK